MKLKNEFEYKHLFPLHLFWIFTMYLEFALLLFATFVLQIWTDYQAEFWKQIWTDYQAEFCCSKCQWTVIINKFGTWKKFSTTFNVLLIHHHKNCIMFNGVLSRLLSLKWFMCACFPTCVTTYFTSIASLASKRCFYFIGNWLPSVSGPDPEFLMGRTRSYFLSKFLRQLRT